MAVTSERAIFLDRDDTLIRNVPYLADPALVDPLPGAADAVQDLRRAGYLLFLFTNQSGIGRGYYSLADAEACNRATEERLGLLPTGFDGICIAPETPDDIPVYRKPSPRYILETLEGFQLDPRQSWMVGDKDSDVEAGLRAGICAARISPDGLSEDDRGGVPVFASVVFFSQWLLQEQL